MLCISSIAGGYLAYLPLAGPCPDPRCHPAVRIEQTWKHDGVTIVDQSSVNRLIKDGWQWIRVRDDQPLYVCLSRPDK